MLTTPIHAIIFDFGGVLINWNPTKLFKKYFANDDQLVENFLKEDNFSEWNLSQDKGYPFSKAVDDLSAQFPQYSHIIRAYDKEWEESITGIITGTVVILYKLKDRGFRLYGLTNWSAEKFSLVRHKYAFFDLFDDIVVSGEVKLIKPEPAIFNLLLLRINRQPEECLMIDDNQCNLESAQNLGFVTLRFRNPVQLELGLEQMGVL
jgi:2-haloacid dehalogenase